MDGGRRGGRAREREREEKGTGRFVINKRAIMIFDLVIEGHAAAAVPNVCNYRPLSMRTIIYFVARTRATYYLPLPAPLVVVDSITLISPKRYGDVSRWGMCTRLKIRGKHRVMACRENKKI